MDLINFGKHFIEKIKCLPFFRKPEDEAMQKCETLGNLENAAKKLALKLIGFDTTENEPLNNLFVPYLLIPRTWDATNI